MYVCARFVCMLAWLCCCRYHLRVLYVLLCIAMFECVCMCVSVYCYGTMSAWSFYLTVGYIVCACVAYMRMVDSLFSPIIFRVQRFFFVRSFVRSFRSQSSTLRYRMLFINCYGIFFWNWNNWQWFYITMQSANTPRTWKTESTLALACLVLAIKTKSIHGVLSLQLVALYGVYIPFHCFRRFDSLKWILCFAKSIYGVCVCVYVCIA